MRKHKTNLNLRASYQIPDQCSSKLVESPKQGMFEMNAGEHEET
jgi:hypothetical protein